MRLQVYTRREEEKLISSVFGPIGFLAWFIVSGKALRQELWR